MRAGGVTVNYLKRYPLILFSLNDVKYIILKHLNEIGLNKIRSLRLKEMNKNL